HTRFSRDWSSDVCSSDLIATETHEFPKQLRGMIIGAKGANLNKLKEEFEVDVQIREGSLTVKGLQPNVQAAVKKLLAQIKQFERSEERRVGKATGCRTPP